MESEAKQSSSEDALFGGFFIAAVVLVFLLPGVVALVTFVVHRLLYRLFRVRWYWTLLVLVICAGVGLITPISTVVSGTGYLWHLVLGYIHQKLHPKPLPGLANFHPATPSYLQLHSPFWVAFGNPKEYATWRVVRSSVLLGIVLGSLLDLVLRFRIWRKKTPTSEERMEQQRATQSRMNDYLVSQAEKRAAKKFRR